MNDCELTLNAFSAYIKKEPVCGAENVTDELFMSFLRRAALHKVLPMAGSALLGEENALNAPVKETLKKTIRQQVIGQTLRNAAFANVYKELTAAGAKPVCVKGITCRSLYPEPYMRLSGDEDLLVSEEDFTICEKKLAELGFEADKDGSDFEVGFINRQNGCRIELHKSLFAPDSAVFGCFNTFFEDVLSTAHTETADNAEIYVPDNDLHFLYLVLHAFKHFIHAGIGIRQLCDIALFAKYRTPSPAAVFEKCAQVNADTFLNAVLLAGEQYFGLDTAPFEAECPSFDRGLDIAPLIEDVMSGGVYGADSIERQHSATITLNHVEAAKNGKKSSVLRSVFPKREKLKGRYTYLEEHPVLLPVAWGQRIIEYTKTKNDSPAIIETGEKRVELLKKYRVIR